MLLGAKMKFYVLGLVFWLPNEMNKPAKAHKTI
jgi:hypothetical protein